MAVADVTPIDVAWARERSWRVRDDDFSLAVGSTDDVPGCDRTPKMGTRGNKLRQDKRKRKRVGGFWVLG